MSLKHKLDHPSLLLGAFFLSGFAALVYQVVWVRQLRSVLGATDFALAVVVGTFMAGLALGSAISGRRSDRLRHPVRVYAVLEVLILTSALFLIDPWIRIGARVHEILGSDAGPELRLGASALISALALLPTTTLMGATLPVLSRHVARTPARLGRDLGGLYAWNTLGAFCGVTFTGFWALETLGLKQSTFIAAGANLIAALLALLAGDKAETQGVKQTKAFQAQASQKMLLLWSFAAGTLGIAHEVVWNRLLGIVVIGTVYAYSTLLATIIAGIGIGSLLGAHLVDRYKEPEQIFGLIQLGIGISALMVVPILSFGVGQTDLLSAHTHSFESGQSMLILGCVSAIALPSILMGATYPALARATVQRSSGQSVGASVGQLYAYNTTGAVVGSLLAGFILIPILGAMWSLELLATANLVLGLTALWQRTAKRLLVLISALGAALLFTSKAGVSVRDIYQARLPEGSTIVHLEEGRTATVMVADHSLPKVRRLWVQSVWVAGTGGSHRMLGHLPLLHVEKPRAAVGIGFGTGQSFATALMHGLRQLDSVDLNPSVLAAGTRFFGAFNGGILEKPETQIHIDDGRSFLARSRDAYDAVVMEPLQPWTVGTTSLYTREFYDLARKALKDRGAIAQWLPVSDIPTWVTRSVLATFAEVFPRTHVYLDGFDLVFVGTSDEAPLSLGRLEAGLDRPGIRGDLEALRFGDALSIASAIVLGPSDVQRFTGNASLLTDDRPFLEFVAPRTMHQDYFAQTLSAIRTACRQPMSAFERPVPDSISNCAVSSLLVAGIIALHEADLSASYAAYRKAHLLLPHAQRPKALWRDSLIRMARHDPAAETRYREHLRADPDFGPAWLNLGVVLAQQGNLESAKQAFQRAAEDPIVSERARAALARFP
ncbi:MAG: fused MFS/spermidine synthase [Myxococcota bacterium]